MGGKFLIFVAFYIWFGTVAAKKFNKVKYNSTGINDANSVLKTLVPLIDQLQVDIARLQECVATPYDDPNWENVCILPPGDRCGVTQLTSCTVTINNYVSSTATSVTANGQTTQVHALLQLQLVATTTFAS